MPNKSPAVKGGPSSSCAIARPRKVSLDAAQAIYCDRVLRSLVRRVLSEIAHEIGDFIKTEAAVMWRGAPLLLFIIAVFGLCLALTFRETTPLWLATPMLAWMGTSKELRRFVQGVLAGIMESEVRALAKEDGLEITATPPTETKGIFPQKRPYEHQSLPHPGQAAGSRGICPACSRGSEAHRRRKSR